MKCLWDTWWMAQCSNAWYGTWEQYRAWAGLYLDGWERVEHCGTQGRCGTGTGLYRKTGGSEAKDEKSVKYAWLPFLVPSRVLRGEVFNTKRRTFLCLPFPFSNLEALKGMGTTQFSSNFRYTEGRKEKSFFFTTSFLCSRAHTREKKWPLQNSLRRYFFIAISKYRRPRGRKKSLGNKAGGEK